MSSEVKWPVSIKALGPTAVGTALWSLSGELYLTAVVKAAYSFADEGEVVPIDTPKVQVFERHIADHPMRGLAAIREVVPRLHKVDVLLRARGYPDERRNRGLVKMVVRDGSTVLLEKSALLCGDRNSVEEEPQPFKSVPLEYENSLGGIGYVANPIGTGVGVMTEKPPNVVDLVQPMERTVGFAPIPATWKVRQQRLGSASRRKIEKSPAVIPENFDWRYFQAAPEDQQVEQLRGGELVELFGVRPMQATYRFYLPKVRASVRLQERDSSDMSAAVDMRLDTLSIDARYARFTLLWRGDLPIANMQHAQSMMVVGGVERHDDTTDDVAAAVGDDPRETVELVDVTLGLPAQETSSSDQGEIGPEGDRLAEQAVQADEEQESSELVETVTLPNYRR